MAAEGDGTGRPSACPSSTRASARRGRRGGATGRSGSPTSISARGLQRRDADRLPRPRDSESMYLVGDIIDGWRLKKRPYWPERAQRVVWRILKRAKRGTRIVYIPGNHDEMMRQFSGMNFGGVEIRSRGDPHHRRRPPPAGAARRRVRRDHARPSLARVRRRRGLPPAAGLNCWSTRSAAGWACRTGRCPKSPSTRSRTRSSSSPASRRWSRTRRRGAASTAWSAAISTPPRCAISAASPITTTATGWKAAPRWSSISTGAWKCSTGPRKWHGARRPAPREFLQEADGALMRIAIVTDAWAPQVNGVVRTLQRAARRARAARPRGAGDLARPVPLDPLPELSRDPAGAGALASGRRDCSTLRARCGPYLDRRAARPRRAAPLPAHAGAASPPPTTPSFPNIWRSGPGCRPSWFWRYIRWFHRPAGAVLVATAERAPRSCARKAWPTCGRGAAASISASFGPDIAPPCRLRAAASARSSSTSAASRSRRISRPSSPAAIPASKVVVGDGPALRQAAGSVSRRAFPRRARAGEELAAAYAGADVFVFPEPDRHVRAGDDRGAGLRHAGRGLPGARPARRAR